MPEAPEARTSVSHRQIIIVSILLAYAALRFWGLTSSCLWIDEIFSVHAAEHAWGEMFWFVAQDLIHPPLFYALLKLWIGLGGESLWWLRFFSVFFALLTVVPFLQLCREVKLKLPETAVALGMLAANGALIKYAQEVRMYSLLLFLSVVSIWLFGRFYFRGKNIWVLTLVNVLLVYTHYFGWLVVFCEVVSILIFQRIKIRHVVTMTAIALASYVPWVWALWKAAAAGSNVGQNISWIERPSLLEILNFLCKLVEPFYYQQTSADPASLYYISIPLLAVIAGAAIYYAASSADTANRNVVYLLAVFTATPVVITVLVSLLLPYSVWGTRHLIIVFVPASVLAAKFIAGGDNVKVRAVFIGVVSIIFAAAFAVNAAKVQTQPIWCRWDSFTHTLKNSRVKSGKPARLCVFEDLAAYHFWFSGRNTADYAVSLIKGVDGIGNDPAYFLPRGFDEVPVITPDECEGDDLYIVFRRRSLLGPSEMLLPKLASEKPLLLFVEKGLKPEIVDSVTASGETAYLVHLTR
jgi:uncharacterized membrane protein